jgi:hypothetical protein
MFMKIRSLALVALVCSLGTVAFAQKTVAPTTGGGADAFAKGQDSATVNQLITLRLPKATALHLDVTNLLFDLTALDGAGWADRAKSGAAVDFGGNMVCVYGLRDTDAVGGSLGDNFYNQKQILPLGTSYNLTPESWPNISVNGGDVVNTYPPIRIGADGQLVTGSKNYFVCYRTFLMQKFSNGVSWDLTVQRTDDVNAKRAIKNIYMQDNPCDTAGAATGLYKLGGSEVAGQPLHLVPKNLSFGPTGSRTPAARARCGYKSWLDDLIIVALPVDGELNGDNTAALQYTLTTTAWDAAPTP